MALGLVEMIRPPSQDDHRFRQTVRLGEIIDDCAADLLFQRQVEKLHELGPRAYDPAELRVFIEASRRRSTSDPGPEAVQ